MKATETNLLGWQNRYGTDEACAQALAQQRWPEGFRCPRCGHDHGYAIITRHSYECAECHYQASLTARTLFHSNNLPLTKRFWAIYLAASDKGGISAVRPPKQIDVPWIRGSRMLRKIRQGQNSVQEKVSNLWLTYLLDDKERHSCEHVRSIVAEDAAEQRLEQGE